MYNFLASRREGDLLILPEEEVKHLKVRRIRREEPIGVIWEGKLYRCTIKDLSQKEARCSIDEVVPVPEPEIDITLYQAVPVEIGVFDFIVQKATEVGVEKLVPVITERSFRKNEVILKKIPRWERIVRESMKQSGRPKPLLIEEPKELTSLKADRDMNILLDNFQEGTFLREIELKGIKSACIVVGPEGGFSRSEVALLKDAGFKSVRLKPYTMRTETAAVVCSSFLINFAGP